MFSLSSFSLYTSMASFSSSHFPVSTISVQQPLRFDALSPKIDMLYEFIDSQLTMRDARLVKWFKRVKLPLIEAQFIPLLHRWHAEDSKSGVAVIILAISCCIAIKNLGAGRISCPMFTLSIPQIVGELMDLSHKLVALDKLHSLASEAGLEQEFLAHFGAKVVLNNTSQEVVFWIALVQKKLVLAFHGESVLSDMQAFHNTKDLERDLATLGLFAFLGRKTRLFLSGMGVKDLDEQVKDFLRVRSLEKFSSTFLRRKNGFIFAAKPEPVKTFVWKITGLHTTDQENY